MADIKILGAGLAGAEAAWQCARRGVKGELFEMRRAGSMLLEIARECAVPAGHALAVDRVTFAARVTEMISNEPRIVVRREEVRSIDEGDITVVGRGPPASGGPGGGGWGGG